MDYGQLLVAALVCFVKAEGGKGASVQGGFGPRGALVRGGLCPTPKTMAVVAIDSLLQEMIHANVASRSLVV